MKKILFTIMLATLTLNIFAQKKLVAFNDKNISIDGRTVKSSDCLRYDYPGTEFTISFTGKYIAAILKPSAGYYVAEIDNNKTVKINTHNGSTNNKQTFLIADNLSDGSHTVKLTLISEGLFVRPEFYGFEIDNNAKTLKPKKKKLSIEFIGNSITCGYGTLAESGDCPFADSTSDFLKTYAAYVSKTLDARRTVVARSGIGIYRNFNDVKEGSQWPMPKIYELDLISSSMDNNNNNIQPEQTTNKKWDFSSVKKPNIVCIGLGTNDMSVGEYNYEKFLLSYMAFVKKVRAHYPSAKIILLNSPMLHDKQANDLYTAITNVVDGMRVLGDTRIYRFDFQEQDESLGYGADYHPSAQRQQQMGKYLTTFIKTVVLKTK